MLFDNDSGGSYKAAAHEKDGDDMVRERTTMDTFVAKISEDLYCSLQR